MGWEWEKKKNIWYRYAIDVDETLSKNCDNGKMQFNCNVNDVECHFDLAEMTQKNNQNQFKRSIRFVTLSTADNKYYNWSFRNEKRKKISYFPNEVNALEIAMEAKKTKISLTINDKNYIIDLINMEQIDEETNIRFSLERRESIARLESDGRSVPARRTTLRSSKENAENVVKSLVTTKNTSNGEKLKKSGKRKYIVQNGAAIDPECSVLLDKAHVYAENMGPFDAMLNQTNLQNNNNKYYIIQLLESNDEKIYWTWFRWGRVGFKGQNNLQSFGGNIQKAKAEFCTKFYDKTKNEWGERKNFSKVPGKYDFLQLDYSMSNVDEEDIKVKRANVDRNVFESKLLPIIQHVISLICNVKAMNESVIEMEYDVEKAPLGRLTSQQIKAGYVALKQIEKLIGKRSFGSALVQAVNDYYTRIPHCFGMRTPPLIKDCMALRRELQLMETLSDIEVALRTLNSVEQNQTSLQHPIDRKYDAMQCCLDVLDKKSREFKLINAYVINTHGPTHKTYKLKLLDVFCCKKFNDDGGFNPQYSQKIGNRRLLWHGSRITNWYGILSRGLLIAPAEAPATGYMFGKGVYFADSCSKSANYCFATKTHNQGLLLLCDVALGAQLDLLEADSHADQRCKKEKKNSVRGLGEMQPDPTKDERIDDENDPSHGTIIPTGSHISTGIKNPEGYTLQYNEYIVYDRRQINLRYLCLVEFDFDSF